MIKHVIITVAALTFTTHAANAADGKVPAKLRTSITKQCDEALREYLIAPMEAKVTHIAAVKDSNGGYSSYICYQARTGGGGYGRVGGSCEFNQNGVLLNSSMRDSETSAAVNCMMAKEYASK